MRFLCVTFVRMIMSKFIFPKALKKLTQAGISSIEFLRMTKVGDARDWQKESEGLSQSRFVFRHFVGCRKKLTMTK